jgi:hypothetical protein
MAAISAHAMSGEPIGSQFRRAGDLPLRDSTGKICTLRDGRIQDDSLESLGDHPAPPILSLIELPDSGRQGPRPMDKADKKSIIQIEIPLAALIGHSKSLL